MSVVLLEHTADPGDVLDGELEHDEGHGRLTNLVELAQVEFHGPRQLLEVCDLVVGLVVVVGVPIVSEEERSDDGISKRCGKESLWYDLFCMEFRIPYVLGERVMMRSKMLYNSKELVPFLIHTGWPKKNGTVAFLGLCSDQQLYFFTLVDRTSFPHYNNTKIMKIWWKTFNL